jgi:AraC-like DNA-binding protein/mannose-6-phosphate isomerase-like protein (cupin superfamily)
LFSPRGVAAVWADVERFAIDALLAAEPVDPAASVPRPFAVQVPELTAVDVHWHDYYELGYVLEGEAAHVINGRAETAAAGSVFLLSPADLHSLHSTTSSPVRLVNAVLHPALVERTLEATATDEVGLPWSVPSLPGIQADAARIVAEVASRDVGWDVVVESALRTLVVALARAAAEDGGPTRAARLDAGPSDHLRRALRHVERHFRDPLTLDEVASVAHLSPHWFSEQFRRATGETFQKFLKHRRLRFARALLESTELGVTEACHAAGFNDPSYFGRAYRARYGIAPSRTPSVRRGAAQGSKRSGNVP